MNAYAEPELVLDGGEPVERQLEGQLRRQILCGVLRPGEQLPTVRAVAVGLSVSPRAVEAAYGGLQREGFLIGGEATGPRVAAVPSGEGRDGLVVLCRDFLRQVADAGHSSADVLKALLACVDRGIRHGQAH